MSTSKMKRRSCCSWILGRCVSAGQKRAVAALFAGVLIALVGCRSSQDSSKQAEQPAEAPKQVAAAKSVEVDDSRPMVAAESGLMKRAVSEQTPAEPTKAEARPSEPPAEAPTVAAPVPVVAEDQSLRKADVVLLEALKAFLAGELYTVWQTLPDSYRKDFNDVLAILATVDPDLYNKAVGVLAKAIDAAIVRKDDILTLAGPMAQLIPGDIVDILKSVKEVLQKGGLLRHEQFKQFSLDVFLKDHGKTLMAMAVKVMLKDYPLDRLAGFTAKLGEERGERATVLVTGPEGDVPVEFVKVEGKWIPEELTRNWAKEMALLKEELGKAVAEVNRDKEAVMKLLGDVEKGVERFEKSGDITPLMNLVVGGRATNPGPGADVPAVPQP